MPKFNAEFAGMVLADAAYHGDEAAATRHGVSTRSIRRWRARLADDQDLSASVRLKKEKLEGDWADEINETITSAIRFIRRATENVQPSSPNAIHAVTGALKILAEVQMTKRVLDARFATNDRKKSS